MNKEKTGWAMIGAVVAAVAASLCCILPVIAVVLGISGFAASQFFEQWRPYLLAVTFALLGVGFYLAYRPRREACEVGSVCERPSFVRWNRAILWMVTALVVVLAAFPYYSGRVARAVTKEKSAAQVASAGATTHLILNIEGMDCGACATLIEKNLSKVPGVRQAEVSFEKKQASIQYDPSQVKPLRFVEVIREAGYKVAPSPDVPRAEKGS